MTDKIPVRGEIDVDVCYKPKKPVYPKDETLNYRWFRNNVGFHRYEDWLDMVRKRPCMNCGLPGPSTVHHIAGSFGSKKTSDYAVIPLCLERGCHQAFENDKRLHDKGVAMLAKFLTDLIAEMYETERGEK